MNFRKLAIKLKMHSPCISNTGYSMSRRIEGVYGRYREISGYERVILVFENGFSTEQNTIKKAVKLIRMVQYDYSRYSNYPVKAFSFGSSEKCGSKNTSLFHDRGVVSVRLFNHLLSLLEKQGYRSTGVIKDIIIKDTDLILIFCRNRDVKFSEELKRKTGKRKLSHTGWIFTGSEEEKMCKYGEFDR